MYIRVNARDNVAILVHPEGAAPGDLLPGGLVARERIPQSHKIALHDLEPGEPVLRYGQTIGLANRPIAAGSWVREELLDMPEAPSLDALSLATAIPPTPPPLDGYTFEGYRNADGGVGTRNILGIATTDRKSTRLNSSHLGISYAVFCLKKKNTRNRSAHMDRPRLARGPARRPVHSG